MIQTDRLAHGIVYIAENGLSPLAQSVRAGRHSWTADEPIGLGQDAGPTPYDLLLAALGTCTSMTLRMYADRHGYRLDHVALRLSHRRSHSDCADAPGKRRTVDHIDRQIWLTGRLDEVQRSRLIEIADRCPIDRTITGEIRISTTIEELDPGQKTTPHGSPRVRLGSERTRPCRAKHASTQPRNRRRR